MAAIKISDIAAILAGEAACCHTPETRLLVRNITLSLADKFKQADSRFNRDAFYTAAGISSDSFVNILASQKDPSFGDEAKHERAVRMEKVAASGILARQQAAVIKRNKRYTAPELVWAFTLDFAEQLTAKFQGMRIDGSVFTVKKGYKFHKIMLHDSKGRSGSIHCFIEKSTGAVCKAASLNAPARHADKSLISNYNISTAHGFKIAVNAADWTGSYLYNSSRY